MPRSLMREFVGRIPVRFTLISASVMFMLVNAANPGYGKSDWRVVFVPWEKFKLFQDKSRPFIDWSNARTENGKNLDTKGLVILPRNRQDGCATFINPPIYRGFTQEQWESLKASNMSTKTIDEATTWLGSFYCAVRPDAVEKQNPKIAEAMRAGTAKAFRYLPSADLSQTMVLDLYSEVSTGRIIGYDLFEIAPGPSPTPDASKVAPKTATPPAPAPRPNLIQPKPQDGMLRPEDLIPVR